MQGQSVLGIGDNPPSASNHDAGGNLPSLWRATHHQPVITMQGNQRHDWGQSVLGVGCNPSLWRATHHQPVITMQGNQRHDWGQSVLGVGCNPSSASKHDAGAIIGTTGGNPPSASKHDAGQPTAQLGIFHPKSVHIYFGIKTILAPIIIPSHIGILSIFD